jgi:hypothetical protein
VHQLLNNLATAQVAFQTHGACSSTSRGSTTRINT